MPIRALNCYGSLIAPTNLRPCRTSKLFIPYPINVHHKRFHTAAMAMFVDADSGCCSSHSSTDTLTQYMKGLSSRPKLVILDIDYTIWPFHVDTHVWPPFKADGNGGATDSHGRKIQLYKDVRKIISELHEAGVKVAAASRTDDPDASKELLGVLGVDKLFDYMEIFPSQKFSHFRNIKKSSGVEYSDMLFFDDEYRNIRDISTLGVTCFYISDDLGIDMERLKKGLKQFSEKT